MPSERFVNNINIMRNKRAYDPQTLSRYAAANDLKRFYDLCPLKTKTHRDKINEILRKSQENARKREDDFAEREIQSMLPYKKTDVKLWDSVRVCKMRLNSDENKVYTN